MIEYICNTARHHKSVFGHTAQVESVSVACCQPAQEASAQTSKEQLAANFAMSLSSPVEECRNAVHPANGAKVMMMMTMLCSTGVNDDDDDDDDASTGVKDDDDDASTGVKDDDDDDDAVSTGVNDDDDDYAE